MMTSANLNWPTLVTAVDNSRARESYHHGELPNVIMSLALAHIEREGTEKLSLRALAREAGVSQTAPYRHFPTKKCLLAALATQGFSELGRQLRIIIDSSQPIEERFEQMGFAYVNFALENPTTYHLMFGSVLADFSEYDMLQRAASDTYAQVQRCEAELIETKELQVDPARFGGVIWAGVHGIASLLLIKREGTQSGDTGAAIEAMRVDIRDSLRILFGHFF
ncbi:MAG: TetR family transcriptional regulator [Pseudomonadales bacterium]|nr:TetR family transcriptional regulator [Pseudomonadales bacterium]